MLPFSQTRTERRSQFKRKQAQNLRANSTEAERALWAFLRSKRLAHLRFRRQQPIGPYIADFYCSAVKLVIELDGSQHFEDANMAHDAERTRWLQTQGYR